ncbi:hypothetical protein H6G54_13190 [Anabaena cylindrica FACHB-243]|uniref:Uncharacterized protein n=1 Tax=Anabaena cylindrica (strain ATCC 27899 / PCC 7122) TaxID=272123 RepID=K9ZN34_ANACC|nr:MULTISPECIES: hypothetical protein [Anabaena]AFZ59705.1 hypothetical protein Anacy_4343 [Anabaena cylindrica PCC 7122]MBD2418633.1 hypothetical protein [Anabaena cylindrica FACHB-243]MBY5283376.1 hypothetical protein [Anabaena sp. CCAP 1446/1C]MBY5307769.1 hypothetical protein [Anabaena sp. CCAP 1446/1C]MCM2406193.1 hypothetical protein [Anabaena sp. CCAP 1446/1C]
MDNIVTRFHLNAGPLHNQAKNYYYVNSKFHDSGITDAIPAILFSAMSIEAFINELPELATAYTTPEEEPEDFAKKLAALLTTVEKSNGQIQLKLLVTYIAISGEPPKLGTKTYQNFVNLFKLRNELVHLKPQDEYDLDLDGDDSPSSKRKLVEKLKQSGLNIFREPSTYKDPAGTNKDCPLPLLELISTHHAAKWACNTAANTVQEIVEKMPNSKLKDYLKRNYTNKYFQLIESDLI